MSVVYASIQTDLAAHPWLSATCWTVARSLVILALSSGALLIVGRRTSAAVRHLVLLTTIVALLALPVISPFMPGWRVGWLPELRPPGSGSYGFMHRPIDGVRTSSHFGAPYAATGSIARANAHAPTVSVRAATVSVPHLLPIAWTLLAIWAAGVMVYAVWIAAGAARLYRLARACPRVNAGPLHTAVADLAGMCELRVPVTVRQAGAASASAMPMTWGVRRPTLLLPGDVVLAEWPEERLRAVLLHEIAHIARCDWLTQHLAQAACAVYWFNPLVWMLTRRMQREAEHACDDRVLLAGVQGPDYAAHLLEIVRTLRAVPCAQAMAQPRSRVIERLSAILEAGRNRKPATRQVVAAAIIATGLVVALLTALRPAAKADGKRQETRAEHARLSTNDLLSRSTERSWRGDWAEDIELAKEALARPHLTGHERAIADWLLFEGNWWLGDDAASDRYYHLFEQERRAFPNDEAEKTNSDTAKRCRATRKSPKHWPVEASLETARARSAHDGFGDAIHFAKYVLLRPEATAAMRAEAQTIIYLNAARGGFADTMAQSLQQFDTEIARVPEEKRAALVQTMKDAKMKAAGIGRKQAEDRKWVNPVSGVDWGKVTREEPINLDFTSGFKGWTKTGGGGPAPDYTMGIDPIGRRPGNPDAWLASGTATAKTEANLVQRARGNRYRGKRIRLSTWIKARDADAAGLFLHLDAPDVVRTWNMLDRPVQGTTEWRRFEWVADVAPNNQGFMFGVYLNGRGKVWVDDVRIEVVGHDVPLSTESNHFTIDQDGNVSGG